MLGFLIIAPFILYWLLAKFVIKKVYKQTQSLNKKRIVTAIFILIPTWDIILGFPIYWYLCATQSGVKIYKTIDNVEGFYVGENHYGGSILLPYEGYRFIDYQDENNSKYYRNSWLDNNASHECVSYLGAQSYDYTQAFKSGKCIVKKELKKTEVSQWEVKQYYPGTTKQIVPVLSLNKFYEIQIYDRRTKQQLGEIINCSWKGGWVHGIISSIETGSSNYFACSNFYINDEFMTSILKPKKGTQHGNN